MRKQDHLGRPLLRVGDIVRSIPKHLDPDPGTVTRILQVNANGAYLVEVQWFTWNSGAHTQFRCRDSKEAIGSSGLVVPITILWEL